VDLRFWYGRSIREEIEVATFAGLGRVPGEDGPVAATVGWLRLSPSGAATGQFSLVHFEFQTPIRNIELDLVSLPHEG
jgi:hypothetical protein